MNQPDIKLVGDPLTKKTSQENGFHEPDSGDPGEDSRITASPDGALSFMFGILGMLLWYTSVFETNLSELAAAAALWLIMGLGALAASLLNMVRGKMRGNMNLLACLLLGFFPGVNAAITMAAKLSGFSYQPKMIGAVYLVGSVFCLAMGIKRMDRPLYRAAGTFFLSAGMLLLSLWTILDWRLAGVLGGWCCFFFSLCMFYYGLSVLYFFMDARLPQGPVLASANQSGYGYKLDEAFVDARSARMRFFSDPGMILYFIMAVFGVMNFASGLWSMSLDEELAMGLVRLLLGTVYFCAALVLLLQGKPSGNITLINAVCFAFFSGGRKMMIVFEDALPFSVVGGMYGLLQFSAALYIAVFLLAYKGVPVYSYCMSWLSTSGLMLFGLSELLHLDFLSVIAAFCFLAFALLAVYSGLCATLPSLPQGKIFQGFAFVRR